MKSLKATVLGTAIVMGLGLSSFAVSAGEHRYDRDSRSKHHKMMMHKLDLTDSQKEQLKAFKETKRESMRSVRAEMKALKKELRQLMQSEELDRGQLANVLQRQASVKAEMMVQKHAAHKNMRSILTDEQRAKMKELREKAQERHQKRHSHDDKS